MESFLSLDFLAKGFLTFSHDVIIVPLIIIGFLTQKNGITKKSEKGSTVWGNACLLILFTMIFNALLKSLFLVPLNPALGKEGFAFPSGHMQVSVVFYGWLFWAYPYWGLRGVILLILSGVGYGLIQQGYHTITDIVGAVIVGVVTLYGVAKITSFSFIQKKSARLGLCLIPLAGLMLGLIEHRTGVSPHIQKTFIGLVGISLFWFFYSRASSRSHSHYAAR